MTTLTSSRRHLPSRRQPASWLRRATRAVLVAGTLLALLAVVGPIWVVRAGLIVAVVAAVAAVLLAWRELTAERRAHAHAMVSASRAHGEQLHAEREQNAAVVEALSDRAVALTARIDAQQRHASELRDELTTARGESAQLTVSLTRRDNQIGSLRRTIKEQAAEIDGLRDQIAPQLEAARLEATHREAQVHMLPRRARIDAPEQPSALELSDARPRDFELTAADPILMPNYEEELRLA